MRVGDLVKPTDNDMSLIVPIRGLKDNKFFNQIGLVLQKVDGPRRSWISGAWWIVKFPAGIYEVRQDAVEVLNESPEVS